MCYNLEVSLTTGILSIIIGFIVHQRELTINQIHQVNFFLIFSSMQLSDSLLWYSGMEKNALNYYTSSILVPLILYLQIFYNLYIRNKLRNNYVNLILVLWFLYLFYKFNGYSVPLCSYNLSSPVWANAKLYLIELLLFIVSISYPDRQSFTFMSIFLIIIKYIFKAAVGTWWCFLSAFFSLYLIFNVGK